VDDLISCPYCGEECELFLDEGGGGSQDYIEDCQVCCKPMRITVAVDENGDLRAHAARLDE
jgi:hypothetical protein